MELWSFDGHFGCCCVEGCMMLYVCNRYLGTYDIKQQAFNNLIYIYIFRYDIYIYTYWFWCFQQTNNFKIGDMKEHVFGGIFCCHHLFGKFNQHFCGGALMAGWIIESHSLKVRGLGW